MLATTPVAPPGRAVASGSLPQSLKQAIAQ
jgi:hypothetical protein